MDLYSLTKKKIYFGTSSWKYEGWKDLIYKKVYNSKKAFNETCLEEYAGQFPTVGIDHTYYSWPTPKGMQRYVEQTPEGFLFGLKVTEAVTVFKYPKLPRYGKLAGKLNPHFLDVDHFKDNFLEVLEPFRDRLGPLMLEFSHFYPGTLKNGREFVDRLDAFFSGLGEVKGFQFGVEMRNSGWLKPPYFEALSQHKVAHVFNSWTKMPPIGEQLALSKGFHFPFLAARLLLKPGRIYKDAVENFSPYSRIQEEQTETRQEALQLIEHAQSLGVPIYVFVNNRFEGCAPKTIEAMVAQL